MMKPLGFWISPAARRWNMWNPGAWRPKGLRKTRRGRDVEELFLTRSFRRPKTGGTKCRKKISLDNLGYVIFLGGTIYFCLQETHAGENLAFIWSGSNSIANRHSNHHFLLTNMTLCWQKMLVKDSPCTGHTQRFVGQRNTEYFWYFKDILSCHQKHNF